jgi:hypothetical protein
MRPLLSSALGLAALLLAAPAAGADQARPAAAFTDSVGVNTHVIYGDTAYGDLNLVRARLRELGVRHIRDGICGDCPWQWPMFAALGQDGIKLDAGAGWPRDPVGVLQGSIGVMTSLAPMIDMVEGANEWDSFSGRDPAWAQQDRDYQRWLHAAVRGTPAIGERPLIGPSLVFSADSPSSWDILGDVSDALDYGNIHAYPGGGPPETNLSAELAQARQISGDKPVVATEAGYHNAIRQGNWDHPGVPEAVAGAYIPRLFLEYFRRGVARTYTYELVDEWPGQAAVNQEASFGLVRSDFSRKPAFIALRNLLSILGDPGATANGPPVEVPLDIDTAAPDLDRLVLRKRDGRVDVVLWRTASVWNTAARRDVAVNRLPTRVRFGGPVERVGSFRPLDAADGQPVGRGTDGSYAVDVGADPVVLEMTPAGPGSADTPAPTAPPPSATPAAPGGGPARPPAPVSGATPAPPRMTSSPPPTKPKPAPKARHVKARAKAHRSAQAKAAARRCHARRAAHKGCRRTSYSRQKRR